MQKGKFVVIEGLDGSGKTTQIELLVKYCRLQQIETAAFHFPQYYQTFFGELAGRYLKGEFGEVDQVNPYLTSLIYGGDRWQAKPLIEEALKAGKLLLSDRYTSASMAFMGAKIKDKKARDKFIHWLVRLEQQVYGCPVPDLVLYLSVSTDISQKLNDKKGKRKYMDNQKKRDIHEKNLVYLERVAQVYLDLCQEFDHWIIINCLDKKGILLSPEDIHKEIIRVLKKKRII